MVHVVPTSRPDVPMSSSILRRIGLAAAAVSAVACAADEPSVALGPADGRDLPPADTGRVAIGDVAPDFTLASFGGEPITLSQYRGAKEVVLVFYRGHW